MHTAKSVTQSRQNPQNRRIVKKSSNIPPAMQIPPPQEFPLSRKRQAPEFISVPRCAERLGVSDETVKTLIHQGKLTAIKLNVHLRVSVASIEALKQRALVSPTPPSLC